MASTSQVDYNRTEIAFNRFSRNGALLRSDYFPDLAPDSRIGPDIEAFLVQNGDAILLGYARNGRAAALSLLRISAGGEIIWETNFGDGNRVPQTLTQLSDGGFVAAGAMGSFDTAGIYVTKIDQDGALIWDTKFDGTQNVKITMDADGVLETDGGSLIAVGRGPLPGGFHLLKIDSEGSFVWHKPLGIALTAYDFIKLDEGSLLIMAAEIPGGGPPRNGPILIEIDADGNILHFRDGILKEADFDQIRDTFDTSFRAYDMLIDTEGNYVFAGQFEQSNFDDVIDAFFRLLAYDFRSTRQRSHGLIFKTDPEGERIWLKTFGARGTEIFAVTELPEGGYATAGASFSALNQDTQLNIVTFAPDGTITN